MRAAVFGVQFEGVLEGLCDPETWCPLCWCKQNFLEEGLSVHAFMEVSLGEEFLQEWADPSSTVPSGA